LEDIISVLNLKNGVGTSLIASNIAYILELPLYHHDKAMHQMFAKERESFVEAGQIKTNSISVCEIDKCKYEIGVYDLGADINYGYVRQILRKSRVVIIPLELGAEVFFKTMATIEYVKRFNSTCKIFILFNKLDNSDPTRERKYTAAIQDEIIDRYQDSEKKIQFYYLRYGFALFRNQDEGFFLLDNYIIPDEMNVDIENFRLLQHIRYHKLLKLDNAKERTEKTDFELKESTFYADHTALYKEFTSKFETFNVFNNDFIDKNAKIIKDMLILTTCIKKDCEPKMRGRVANEESYL